MIDSVLHSLLTAPGPPGHEEAPAAAFREACRALGADIVSDVMGSTVATLAGTGEGKSVAFVGHADEIGLIVHHIDDRGFLWVSQIGGWDPQVLVGQRVEVHTRDGQRPGVVARKPIHLLKGDAREKAAKLEELHIDIGAKDGDEARSWVRIGDVAIIGVEPLELPNGRIVSRALDNRIGCFIAYEALRIISEAGGAPGPVSAVATVQEETGSNGAQGVSYSLHPDVAIAIDVSFASDQPGIEERERGVHPFGSGVVLTRGPALHPYLYELLEETAREQGIPFTVEVAGRNTATDADGFFKTRGGIATGLISVPCRYIHSPVEMVDMADVEAAAKLLAAFTQRLPADAELVR